MSIGDKLINAQIITEIIPETESTYEQVNTVEVHGITYREWLIGMLASNPAMYSRPEDSRYEEILTARVITYANAIIKQLDKEVK